MSDLTLVAEKPVHFPQFCPVCEKPVRTGETVTLTLGGPPGTDAPPLTLKIPTCSACWARWEIISRYNRVSQRVFNLMMIAALGICGGAYKAYQGYGWLGPVVVGLGGAIVLLGLNWLITLPFRPEGVKLWNLDL